MRRLSDLGSLLRSGTLRACGVRCSGNAGEG